MSTRRSDPPARSVPPRRRRSDRPPAPTARCRRGADIARPRDRPGTCRARIGRAPSRRRWARSPAAARRSPPPAFARRSADRPMVDQGLDPHFPQHTRPAFRFEAHYTLLSALHTMCPLAHDLRAGSQSIGRGASDQTGELDAGDKRRSVLQPLTRRGFLCPAPRWRWALRGQPGRDYPRCQGGTVTTVIGSDLGGGYDLSAAYWRAIWNLPSTISASISRMWARPAASSPPRWCRKNAPTAAGSRSRHRAS